MNNLKNNLEQPFFINSHGEEVSHSKLEQNENKTNLEVLKETLNAQQNKAEDRAELDIKNGSKYGKFKDSDTLLEAYNNLQSDYTKKCQNLSELQKKLEDKDFQVENSPEKLLDAMQNQSRSFFENNPQAEEYKKQVFDILQQDKSLLTTQNPFEQAWIKYLKNNFVDKSTLIKDPKFLEDYVFSNKEITNKIVGDYFASLHTQENPILISNQKGSKTVLASPSKPKSIEEAGKLVEGLFS